MRALITGVLGQDGSYLAEQLIAQDVLTFGITRRPNVSTPAELIHADLLDQDSLEVALRRAKPDVVFNLAAVTAPGAGWGALQPPLLADVTAVGVVRLLDAMVRVAPNAKLVHASSSAIYDPVRYGLYGAAKRFAHDAVVGYRTRLHCSNAVLFSHTSPRQDPRFLARRICSTLAAAGKLTLGDVKSSRDWGYAPDYCEALQVIATLEPGDWQVRRGETHTVGELAEAALTHLGLRWGDHIVVDPQAPKVPDEICGDDYRVPMWSPPTSFHDMVKALL